MDLLFCYFSEGRILGDLESCLEANFEKNLVFKIQRAEVWNLIWYLIPRSRNIEHSKQPQKKLCNKAVSPRSSKHVLFWHFLNTRLPNTKSDVDKNEVDQLSNVVHPYYLLNLTPNNSVYSVILPSPNRPLFHFHFIIIKYIYISYTSWLQYSIDSYTVYNALSIIFFNL